MTHRPPERGPRPPNPLGLDCAARRRGRPGMSTKYVFCEPGGRTKRIFCVLPAAAALASLLPPVSPGGGAATLAACVLPGAALTSRRGGAAPGVLAVWQQLVAWRFARRHLPPWCPPQSGGRCITAAGGGRGTMKTPLLSCATPLYPLVKGYVNGPRVGSGRP